MPYTCTRTYARTHTTCTSPDGSHSCCESCSPQAALLLWFLQEGSLQQLPANLSRPRTCPVSCTASPHSQSLYPPSHSFASAGGSQNPWVPLGGLAVACSLKAAVCPEPGARAAGPGPAPAGVRQPPPWTPSGSSPERPACGHCPGETPGFAERRESPAGGAGGSDVARVVSPLPSACARGLSRTGPGSSRGCAASCVPS